MTENEKMAERIRDKRIENKLTMEELGALVGVQPSAVNKWEKGIVSNIPRSRIARLAKVLNCNPVWLMGIDESPENTESYNLGHQMRMLKELSKSNPKAYEEISNKLNDLYNKYCGSN